MHGKPNGPPHDAFFRHLFSHPDAAVDLIRAGLPAEIASGLDFGSLKIHQQSYIADNLRATCSDILFELTRNGVSDSVYIYVLVEHKSAPDRWALLQLLGYMVEIWKQHRRDNPGQQLLPPVIPLLFSHSARVWPYALDFSALVALHSEQELRHTPQFNASLYETAGRSAGEVRGGARFVAGVRLLQAYREIAKVLGDLVALVRDALPPTSETRAFLTAMLEYAFRVSAEPRDRLVEAVRQVQYRPAEEAMMTIAEQWKTEGKTEGKLEGKQAVLMRLIERKYGILEAERQLIQSTQESDKLDAALDAIIEETDKDSLLRLPR